MIQPFSEPLERAIARKLMVDIRRYADSGETQPVLSLPPSLAEGLAAIGPCGVILFAENVDTASQCRALTAEIAAVLTPVSGPPLIAIDQEGGRVTRLPRRWATGFSGNMALAACPPAQRQALVQAMASAQAAELAALGINFNCVPSLDINANPANPVINVRAFGDDPVLAAELGGIVVRASQAAGVACSPKHFPGHGDTSVDSHTGLPCVNKSAAEARAVDIAPFAKVIADAAPAAIMTAHIQYPALDDSTLPDGVTLRPATLSRTILTDILRGELGYRGVIITDALDMQAISKLLSPAQAVVECFRAGVDIALMPLLVRGPADLEALRALVRVVAKQVRAGALDEEEILASADRVAAMQAQYASTAGDLAKIGGSEHRALERDIAAASITALKAPHDSWLRGQRVHLLMPGPAAAEAMAAALQSQQPGLEVSWQSLADFSPAREREQVAAADTYLVGIADPPDSAVVAGGAEDLAMLDTRDPLALQQQCLREAAGKQRLVCLLRSPFVASAVATDCEGMLACYDSAPQGPAYAALAAVLSGNAFALGQCPVQLPLQQ